MSPTAPQILIFPFRQLQPSFFVFDLRNLITINLELTVGCLSFFFFPELIYWQDFPSQQNYKLPEGRHMVLFL